MIRLITRGRSPEIMLKDCLLHRRIENPLSGS
jgi:hypothetical protein